MALCTDSKTTLTAPIATANSTIRQVSEEDSRPMNHHPHILNAACNLLGICFIVIGSLKLADLNSRSYGDEAAWAAASLFFVSIILLGCSE